MRKKKKIFFILIFLVFIVFVAFKLDNINCVNDISKLNTITIYDKDDNIIYEQNNSHQANYVKLEDVNELFIKALIAVEDQNFYQHPGFDFFRIIKVFFTNIINKEKHGASTITQQYVKNLYLSNHKTYIRKIKEIYLAVKLENIYSKDQILEGYLNTIYFASNIYGLYDASHYYFNKEPRDLDLNEIALLIAMIKAPNTYSPTLHYEAAMKRKNQILDILKSQKIISDSQYNLYSKIDITIYGVKHENYTSDILYFKDLVLSEFYSLDLDLDFGKNYIIHTNFDTLVNYQIQSYLNSNIQSCNASSIIVDNSGFYISFIGGKNYYEQSYNIALNANRDIGSTIKPLLYYSALDRGFDALTTFTSEKCDFYLQNQKYSFSNFHDKYENKKITLGYALATSDNIYAVKTHLFLGMNTLVKFLEKFQVSAESKPTLALGNVSLSLKQLVNIYHTFSSLGNKYEFKAITSISFNKETVYQAKVKKKALLNSSDCYILNDLMTLMFDNNLSNNVSVTGSTIASKLKAKVAGKSGLTDYDSYMIGFNPLYTVGVWCGYTDNTKLDNSYYQALPKQIFTLAFNQLMVNKEKDIWFKCPSNVSYNLVDPTLFNTGYKRLMAFKN